ncbi:sphingolipid delta4-desaturase [Ascodesmis nigricans]|uniref:Sphingolipid delta(4)-desaturase n=1 Tax=Ascodesmis nigricans TaxID=341454 RepID=A0A4S2N2A2_9PEZI|nr:sphingolipid delta4-desaturase [Ascodesmis nigricans]
MSTAVLSSAVETVPSKSKASSESESLDWLWTYQEEPHRTRRMQIIKAHPEVTKLCGPEPLTKYVVLLVVSIQLAAAFLLRNSPVFSWPFFLTAYVVGATANQNLFLAIHEISHNLAFRWPMGNRLLAIFANIPIGVPYSAAFRPYHLMHHKSLGVEGVDTDLPTKLEAVFLNSILGKAFFCTFQILFYALRPIFVVQLPFTDIHLLNLVFQLSFDAAVVHFFGWNAMIYFLASSFLAGSLHPCAGHFIAEHYVFEKSTPSPRDAVSDGPAPPETYSYYGPLNFFTYNVGLHNEHHDFPAVPWTRLPKLREIAKEFYEPLPTHTSWSYVIFQFITDCDVTLWSRVKREQKGKAKVADWTDAELEVKDEKHCKSQ